MEQGHATPPADAAGSTTVSVLLPLALDIAYDYRVPAGMAPTPGAIVEVPLGSRRVVGVVWGTGSGGVAPAKLKDIAAVRPVPPLPESLRALIDWVADYTLASRGAVLRMALSVPAALEPPAPRLGYARGPARPDRLTPARAKVLALLDGAPPLAAADIRRETGVGMAVIKGLVEAGALVEATLPRAKARSLPDASLPGPTLTTAQIEAAAGLIGTVKAGGFSVTLLDGVTGSGKTEVYFEAISAALSAGKQALVLVPEIALTPQWRERFRARFGAAPAEWHSELGAKTRRETWRGVAAGEAPVVVGARSALFLPFPRLGLIVADEEHDQAFKQEDGVIYQARDMAVVRARFEAAPIVLASATPSLESLANVEAGRYRHLSLPERHGDAELPTIAAIDLRRHPPPRGAWLAPPLREALAQTIAAGEQALLFLNRRGYAPLTLCRACGHRLECPNCTTWLVEHRLAGRLACHHCGYQAAIPEACPACGALGKLAACGPGVERLAEEVAALFPAARYELATSDTIATAAEAAALIGRIEAGGVDVLIGTQIVAKGHHFPLLTLVGVVDADLGLAGGDLRAAERTFQLLQQVSGRAGRADRHGRVFLQTHMPEHPVMAALVSGDRARFVAEESAARKVHGLPPYGRLAAVIVSSRDERAAAEVARALARIARKDLGPDTAIEVFGPAAAPLALLRGRHRQRLLIKAPKEARLQPRLRRWLAALPRRSGVTLQVDIDPYSFL
ncbi:MAG: primosomal protein N' [Alphaproteobacteria bacterium]